MKIPPKIAATVLDALRRKWLVVVVCFAVGVVVAVASFTRNVPPIVRYQADATVALAKSPVAGLDFACNAATATTLVSSQQVIAGAKTPATELTTTLSSPAVLTLSDREATKKRAPAAVNERAGQFVRFCNADAWQRTERFVRVLQQQTADRQRRLAQLDRVLLPAQTASATVPTLLKRQGDLLAQQDALTPKVAETQTAASQANAQAATAAQLGRQEIYKADPLWVFLQTQLQKDSQTLAQLSSQYTPAFGRVQNFTARVKTDLAQLAARERTLDQQPLSLSATYRAAQTTQQQAAASAANAQQQLDGVTKQATTVGSQIAKVTAPNPTVAADKRQHDALLASYNALAAQLHAADAQRAQMTAAANGPFAPLGSAAGETAVGVKFALAFAAALVVLSLVVGIILAVVLALLDNRLLTRRQITALYGKPVIGTLQK